MVCCILRKGLIRKIYLFNNLRPLGDFTIYLKIKDLLTFQPCILSKGVMGKKAKRRHQECEVSEKVTNDRNQGHIDLANTIKGLHWKLRKKFRASK